MRPERVSNPEAEYKVDRIWMVAQWKWELDSGTAWYRKLYFKLIFRPFLHFSWRIMKIPCPKATEIQDGKETYPWFENKGFFSSEDAANLACVGKWDGYKDVPLDRNFPAESAQYSSLVFPRQTNPRQHRRTPTFSLILKHRKQEERQTKQLNEYLAELNRVLDR